MNVLNLILGLFLMITTNHQSVENDVLLGNWYAEKMDQSTIEIYKQGEKYFGKIITSEKEKYVGKIVLKNISYESNKKVWKGTIDSPQRNISINATLSLEENNKQLKVVGRKYFMTKTYYWNRIE